jgi:hypothetical protein
MVRMSESGAALLGVAIGAVATLGASLVQAVSQRRAEAARRRDERDAAAEQKREALAAERAMLNHRYLFQLQDAVESLDNRLDNWARRGGEEHSERVDPGYWRITMIYALARALGAERILAIEGAYPQIESVTRGLGEFLKESGVERVIDQTLGESLFHYHRQALAESALEEHSEGFRVVTYTQFRRRSEDVGWSLGRLFETAYAAIAPLKSDEQKLSRLRGSLGDIRAQLEAAARAPEDARDIRRR